MKKICVVLALLIGNLSFASDNSPSISSFFKSPDIKESDTPETAEILVLKNITEETNTIANIKLNYYASSDCSSVLLARANLFDKRSTYIVKHKNLLKILAASVYKLGEQQIGVERMSAVRSISVTLGTHYSKGSAKESYFSDPTYINFSKSYCVKNVICSNGLCQTQEYFTPQADVSFLK
ncbi:MAG: hypothetical protein P1U74_07490 [Legionellaceae bacterium]|nr:hypothetical protein [Legionellaceae bacterium]